jgi:hypothetical protein
MFQIKILSLKHTTTFLRHFLPSAFDENSPHGFRRRAKEVTSAVPGLIFRSDDKTEVGFMHQCRWLQRLTWTFESKLCSSKFSEFFVNQR